MTVLDRKKDNPWVLKTPPGTSEYTMHVDEKDGKPVLVCTVGTTVLLYDARCVDDLYAMLKQAGGWVELGGADEQKPAKEGTVEAWGRSADNPVGARVAGLPVAHLYAVTFGIGAACVAVAGCAMVSLIDFTPTLGPSYTLLAFVIVIVGGLGSMVGALLGGLLIGVSEALAGVLIAPSAKSMVSFGLLILVLLARPQGLMGGGRK